MQKEKKRTVRKTGNGAFAIAFAAVAFFFYLQMVNGGIATHDELANFLRVRTNTYFSELNWSRWGMILMSAIPSYIHALCTSEWTYRILTMAGLLTACCSFGLLLGKLTNSRVARLALLLFFMFAQIELDHDGLISFSFSYQLNTCYVFIALSLYYDYLRQRKLWQLFLSAAMYLVGCIAYEAFMLYGLLFFILDLYHWIDRKKLSLFNLFKDLALHAALAVAYFAFYLVMKSRASEAYGDNTIGAAITIREVLGTNLKMMVGLFPLNYSSMSLREYLAECIKLTPANCLRWFVIVLALIAVVRLIRSAKRITFKTYARISIFCLVGMFLPGLLTSLTDQYISWVYYGASKSYAVSYYAYFFIIAWIAMTVVFLYQRLPLKRTFLCLAAVAIGVVTEFTLIGNETYIATLDNMQDKYDLFCALVDSDYFASIEDGAQLYAPGFIGIHYDINTLARYANARTGKNVSSTNYEGMLNFDAPVYELRTDTEKDVAYFSRIDAQGCADEVFILALEDLGGCGIIADRDDQRPASALNLDGETVNVFGTEIVSGELDVHGRQTVVRCEGMIAETVEIYRPSGSYDNGLVETFGIYGQEDFGRWAQREFSVCFDNQGGVETMEVSFRVVTSAQPEGAELTVSCNDFTQTLVTSGETVARLEIPLQPGRNELRFASSAPDLDAPGDARSLNMQIRAMSITIDGSEIKLTANS